MTHTPGPWTFNPTSGSVLGADGRQIAYVSATRMDQADVDSNSGVASANGWLIAAGPALLEALQQLVAIGEAVGLADHQGSIMDHARAAIARAKGETK